MKLKPSSGLVVDSSDSIPTFGTKADKSEFFWLSAFLFPESLEK